MREERERKYLQQACGQNNTVDLSRVQYKERERVCQRERLSVCVLVCVCVYLQQACRQKDTVDLSRVRERERERERESVWKRERLRVCVGVCLRLPATGLQAERHR